MKIKKNMLISIILFIIIGITKNVYADDLDTEEESNIAWIYETIENASSIVSDEPVINSRAAVIYDRNSNEVIWGKEENV